MKFETERDFDVIAMGRASCDLYSEQTCLLKDSLSFARYLGGSPANTAAAMSKLGLKTAFIGCVSDDGMGQFVREALIKFGIDVSHVRTDTEGHRTAITIGEITGGGKCSSIFYRNLCADLFLTPEDMDEHFLASASAILISGTSLTHEPSRTAVLTAMQRAKESNTKIIFDPDYRKGTWNSEAEMKVFLATASSMSDIVIGTADEFALFSDALLPEKEFDSDKCANELIRRGCNIIVIKNGKEGSCAYEKDCVVRAKAFNQKNVTKTFGAGDSFAAGFIRALLHGADLLSAQTEGAACAAVTISGRSCSDAAPDLVTLTSFLKEHGIKIRL